jgi:superfamily II RNA helicase
MSGRAGRRGFDSSGNIIFSGINRNKMESLFRGNLPPLKGTFSLSVSFVLRCFMLYSQTIEEEKPKVQFIHFIFDYS